MAIKPVAKGSAKPAQQAKSNVPAVRTKSFDIVEQQPDYIATNAARGAENVGVEDIVIPRLELIQSQSPAVKRNDPKFIKGAELGMLNNSVTRELYGDIVYVVPVYYTKQWLVWRDQKKGGGFAGAYDTQAEAQARADKEGGAKDGWEALDTPQHLCLLMNKETGRLEEIMISLPRTKAKVSRAWNSMMRMAGSDTFSRVYKIATAEETNKQGQTYFNYVISPVGFPPEFVYREAEALYKRIASGDRRVVMDTSGLAETHENETEM